MKRYNVWLFAITVALLMGSTTASFAIFPFPDGSATFKMLQGWHDGDLVWYFCTDTNDIRFSQTHFLTLAPKLTSGIGAGAAEMYIVRNPQATQGPIFDAVPGALPYSAIWRVIYVDWQPGFTKVPIISKAQIVALVGAGAVIATRTNVVLDCPIVAVGPLGGPWYPAPVGRYRIKQGVVFGDYAYTKLIRLPTFKVFCDDEITQRVHTEFVIIPDADGTRVANFIGANYAPGLAVFPFADTMRFWFIEESPWLCQFPVIETCPTSFSWRNIDFDYSPVERLTVIRRTGVAPSAVINNEDYVQLLIGNGRLTVIDEAHRINAPVVPSHPLF